MARSFKGDAIVTTITANINASDTTIALASSSGWPSGAGGKAFTAELVSADGTTHEKVLIASRSGLTLTVSARGYDDTVATSFLTGATIRHVFPAIAAQEAADHIEDLTPHIGSDLLRPATHDLAARHTIGDGTSSALLQGGIPTPIGTSASAGSGNTVARGNHSHMLDAAVAGSGLALNTGVLAVVVDDTTIAISLDTLLVKDSGISTAKIASQAVTNGKLGPDAVDGTKIADASINSEHYVDGSIDPEHLATTLKTVVVCTAGTRPGSPAEGQPIYETDTGNFLIYYGVTLGWKPPWNVAWGHMGQANSSANQTGIGSTATDLTGMSVTFTAVSGRRYKTSVHLPRLQIQSGLGEVVLQITDGSNTVVGQANWSGGANQVLSMDMFDMASGLTPGSITRKARLRIGSNTVDFGGSSNPGTIVVEDVGPSGNAP